MNNKARNLFVAGLIALGVTASGTAAVAAFAAPQAGHSLRTADAAQANDVDNAQVGQTAESVNDNKDDAQVGQVGESVNDNKDDGQKGQTGETGESVNDNKDQKDAGNKDGGQQGQSGDQK